MKRLISVIFICILLLGCRKIKYGTVIERWHEPENSYFTVLPIAIYNGKTTSVMMIPYYIHDNEDWGIRVMGVTEKGDTVIRKFYVSRASFDTLKIGKFICFDGMCDEDTNNTKTER